MKKNIFKIFLISLIIIPLFAFFNGSEKNALPEDHFSHEIIAHVNPQLNKWSHIKEQEILRVLVTPSRTNYFLAQGKSRGFEHDMFEEFEKGLRKSLNNPQFKIVYVPVAHNDLLPSLMQGYGDIAAAMLTITPEREKIVDFSSPYLSNISEVLIRHKSAPQIKTLEDLSGKKVFIADGSSYLSSLIKVNNHLKKQNLKPIKLVPLKGLNTDDVLELLNTGLFQYSFADHTFVDLWKSVLPDIRVHKQIFIGRDKNIAWAMRKDSPQLKKHLDTFANKNRKGSLLGNIFFKRYYQRPYWIDYSLLSNLGKLEKYKPYFIEAGEKYDFNWLFLAMQAFQESSLNPKAKSHAGAIGIMQLLPSTAKDMGVDDLYDPYQNIMGGAKYMAWIRNNYFKDLDDKNRLYFYLASYNAGFRNVQNWRKEARSLGYNPDIWFGHVEHVALQKTGLEPVCYVSNIHKAYTASSAYFRIAKEKIDSSMKLKTRLLIRQIDQIYC
ncbi:transporter substrate-binding domain-containing protein [Lentisphaera profundi]|uniref:Transporter substrate-binding domain-containing protein n=1 Tax=Lentisphaera profundi TaxID=1658616 RepID=A0ABY7VSL7_9BACT|nr:transporter substrate-binding domain-containing protein [Lentisphaera profundi]WDE96299.1 transporter substrate-binding domain-containing protein [Lentisphaera profundi]